VRTVAGLMASKELEFEVEASWFFGKGNEEATMGAYVSYTMVLRKKRCSYENESTIKNLVNLGVVKVPSRLLAEANLGAAVVEIIGREEKNDGAVWFNFM